MEMSDTLRESKAYILRILEKSIKDRTIIKRVYCLKCKLLIFGVGSLLRSSEWEDRCECERINPLDNLEGYAVGCLFVWGEVEL